MCECLWRASGTGRDSIGGFTPQRTSSVVAANPGRSASIARTLQWFLLFMP